MNLYLRYFANELLAHTIEEVSLFLSSIPDLRVDDEMIDGIDQYWQSSSPYPKRFKIRPKVYFILIKTTAESMEEFKAHRNKQQEDSPEIDSEASPKVYRQNPAAIEQEGWYEGEIYFKRVIPNPQTGKFQYQDTRFVARLKATSGEHCYERIIAHLKNRQDIDPRSQYPSVRGRNFSFSYLGKELQND